MTIFDPRDQAARSVDSEYHAVRERARKTAFSPEEFGPIDRERFDLEDAGITGEDHPDTYDGRDELSGAESDMRDDPTR